MPDLFLNRNKITNLFSLRGNKENDITCSLGWVLAQSPGYLKRFLRNAAGIHLNGQMANTAVVLQEFRKGDGITDVEIRNQNFHLIIEAKRYWDLPRSAQLGMYARRLRKFKSVKPLLVTMSEASENYARQYQRTQISGIPIRHVSWSTASDLANGIRATHRERRLLRDFQQYIATLVNMQPQEMNWAFVVSLSYAEWAPGVTFIDVVEKRKRYFHPYGTGGWPKEPPNYLAFRYDGRLQRIHHVEKTEVVRNFRPHFREAPDRDVTPHLLYRLGPPFFPTREVKTGNIFRAGRCWAMIDLLLTSKTIVEASRKSYARV